MVMKDLQSYASGNWAAHMASITKISKIGNSRCSLVNNSTMIYNFDGICKSMFPAETPSSVDGLSIRGNSIELIEFKSGFKQKITKETLDPKKSLCEKTRAYCQDYWDLFFENQDRKKAELTSSIRSKAIESYITLEKHIFPCCSDITNRKPIKIELIIVIDEDEIDSMEDTLAELSEPGKDIDNCIASIRQSLKRLNNRTDARGSTYYYDNIKVMSAYEFVGTYLQNHVS